MRIAGTSVTTNVTAKRAVKKVFHCGSNELDKQRMWIEYRASQFRMKLYTNKPRMVFQFYNFDQPRIRVNAYRLHSGFLQIRVLPSTGKTRGNLRITIQRPPCDTRSARSAYDAAQPGTRSTTSTPRQKSRPRLRELFGMAQLVHTERQVRDHLMRFWTGIRLRDRHRRLRDARSETNRRPRKRL